MKAYLLNKEQIARILDIGENYRNQESSYYLRPERGFASIDSILNKIIKELQVQPIELDDAMVAEIASPCRYFPKSHIIGFSQSNGDLRGVFVKDTNV